MDQTAENSCGSHGLDANGQPLFDYTCDDCMIPHTLEPDDIDQYGNRYANYEEYMRETGGYKDNTKGISQATKSKKTRPKTRVSDIQMQRWSLL